jgi:hypothetical protein
VVEQIGIVHVVNVVAEQMQKIGPPQTHDGTVWQISPLLPHDPTAHTPPPPQLIVDGVLELLVVEVSDATSVEVRESTSAPRPGIQAHSP